MKFSDPTNVERAFYEAFSKLDAGAMRRVWCQSDAVYCIHPGGPALRGIDAIVQSWAEIFDSADPPSIEFRPLERQTGNTLAIHLVEESIRPGSASGKPASTVLATNTYLLQDGEWHMFSHHSSLPLVKGSRTRSRRTMH
jgi:ketosteroid isomerase-like protein